MRTSTDHLSQFKIDTAILSVLGEVEDWTLAFFGDVAPALPLPERHNFKELVRLLTETLRPHVIEAVRQHAAAHPELYEREQEDLRQEYEAGEEYR